MRIIIFGDSITQGHFDLEKGGWANRLHIHAMSHSIESDWEKDIVVFNLGIYGDSIVKLGERFDSEFERRKRSEKEAVITVFAYGVNDSMSDKEGEYGISPEKFREIYESFIVKAKDVGRVVLIGIAPIDESVLDPIPWHPTHSYLESGRVLFNKQIEELATVHGCLFISMDDVFGKDISAKTVDGIHPNSEGHSLMFERVREVLEKEKII